MKKIVLLSICYWLLTISTVPVWAVKPATDSATKPNPAATPSGKTLSEERQKQLKELRENLATIAAEQREKAKKAWSGEIKAISGKNISLTTKQGEKTVATDDDTLFFRISAGGRKSIQLSDLVVGEKVVALGQVDAGTRQMTAKVIYARVYPLNINGKVTAVDTEEGTLTVQTPARGTFKVDVEVTTKILIWTKAEGLTKGGLSKIKVGDRVHVNGLTPTKPKEGENRLTANRILVLPGKAVGITGEKSATPSASPTASPKASPTATPAEE